jgi:DNA/RNA endonuclease YhcR with UshA esterase domain
VQGEWVVFVLEVAGFDGFVVVDEPELQVVADSDEQVEERGEMW